eukprot:13566403-Heterocapsa_arctica.AAC.1
MAQLPVGSLRGECVPSAFAFEWEVLPAAVTERLVEVGWTTPGLGTWATSSGRAARRPRADAG